MENDDDKIVLTKDQMVVLIDPFQENRDKLNLLSVDDLEYILFKMCTARVHYRFEDYEYSKKRVDDFFSKRSKELERKTRELAARERRIREAEEALRERQMQPERERARKRYESEQSEDYVRPPIPSKREVLIPSFATFPTPPVARRQVSYSTEDILHQSEIDENERYTKQRQEEEEFQRAIKASLEEQENRIPKQLVSNIDYDKFFSKSTHFTKEIVDNCYNLLKEQKFTEFKDYIDTLDSHLAPWIWNSTSDEGSKLKQLFLRKENPHKCFEKKSI